jgi:hypothetical protein
MEPIIVHVSGDMTAAYAVAGTVFGAIVGAGASWLQQKSKIGADKAQLAEQLTAEKERLSVQLAAEKERLTERLTAEESRLSTQLAHNREQVELEALRAVLDEGGEALAKGKLIVTRLANLWRHDLREGMPPAEADQREIAQLAHSVGSRLWLRLPSGDLVLGRYEEATDALNEAAQFFIDNAAPGNFAEHKQALEELEEKLEASILDFWRPAQERYGPKIQQSV